MYLAGERADPDTIHWAEKLLQKPVIDHWWQTETSWTISGNFKGLGLFDTKYGSAGKPAPGYDVKVLKEDGIEAKPGDGDISVLSFLCRQVLFQHFGMLTKDMKKII